MKITTDLKYLKQKSEEIKFQGIESEPCEMVETIIKDLEDTLADKKTGIGLSAIQIGIPKRVGIIRIPNKEPINLVNPIILEKYDKIRLKQEACLSLPGLYIDTIRYKGIVIENGVKREKFVAYGLEAVAIQHEIDHFNGLTILDRKWKKRR